MRYLKIKSDRCPATGKPIIFRFGGCEGCEYRNIVYTTDRNNIPYKQTINCVFEKDKKEVKSEEKK